MGHFSEVSSPRQAWHIGASKKIGSLQRRTLSADSLLHREARCVDHKLRYVGLSRQLRRKSDSSMHQFEARVADIEAYVPIEHAEALRSEFEHRCSFGDRSNLELMSSAKWVKFLKERGVIVAEKSMGERRGSHNCIHSVNNVGGMRAAQADLIFSKVLRGGDSKDSKGLTYSLFCRALCHVATTISPHMKEEEAFVELVGRICSTGGTQVPQGNGVNLRLDEASRRSDALPPVALDEDTVTVLGHFRPALEDLFHTICCRDSKSKTGWDSTNGNTATPRQGFSKQIEQDAPVSPERASMQNPSAFWVAAERLGHPSIPVSYGGVGVLEVDPAVAATLAAISAGAGTGTGDGFGSLFNSRELESTRPRRASGVTVLPEIMESENESDQESEAPLEDDRATPDLQSTIPSTADLCSPEASLGEAGKGSLTRQLMLGEQFVQMCRELEIVPELLTRREALQIVKRGQCSESNGLSVDAFMDVLADCAITSYSKPPFREVYARAHEKIYAFFIAVLPSTSRELHERFLYSRARK